MNLVQTAFTAFKNRFQLIQKWALRDSDKLYWISSIFILTNAKIFVILTLSLAFYTTYSLHVKMPCKTHKARMFNFIKEPKNRFQGINSASTCRLVGRYDNPIPTLFLAPIDCLKLPALDKEDRFYVGKCD